MRKFKYGDHVKYAVPSFGCPNQLIGHGVVVGVLTYNLGTVYFIDDLSGNFPNDEYPYKVNSFFEGHLEMFT